MGWGRVKPITGEGRERKERLPSRPVAPPPPPTEAYGPSRPSDRRQRRRRIGHWISYPCRKKLPPRRARAPVPPCGESDSLAASAGRAVGFLDFRCGVSDGNEQDCLSSVTAWRIWYKLQNAIFLGWKFDGILFWMGRCSFPLSSVEAFRLSMEFGRSRGDVVELINSNTGCT